MRTFEDWSERGYKILKGSKGTQIDGRYYFSRDQVIRMTPSSHTNLKSSYREHPPTFVKESPFKQQEPVYYADGSGYLPASGPSGPLYFDKFGNT